MFDTDQLIADCRAAVDETEPRRAIHEVLDRYLARPEEIADGFRPVEGGINVLFSSPHLTVLNVVWAPKMVLYPHDHRMWAAIGIYTGAEDNAFYRRAGDDRRSLAESGGKRVELQHVLVLGDDVIHSVTNPLDRLTGAIHVYGGDFINQRRSQWGPGRVEERPYDLDEARQQFADANRAWRESISRAAS